MGVRAGLAEGNKAQARELGCPCQAILEVAGLREKPRSYGDLEGGYWAVWRGWVWEKGC